MQYIVAMEHMCTYCRVKLRKPYNVTQDNWDSVSERFCSTRCRSLMRNVDGKGYLARYLWNKEIMVKELKEAMDSFGGITYSLLSDLHCGSKVVDKQVVVRIGCSLMGLNPDMSFGMSQFDYRRILPYKGGVWYLGDGNGRKNSKLRQWCVANGVKLIKLIEEKDRESRAGGSPTVRNLITNGLDRYGNENLEIRYGDVVWRRAMGKLLNNTEAMDSRVSRYICNFLKECGYSLDYRSLLQEIWPRNYRKGIIEKYRRVI